MSVSSRNASASSAYNAITFPCANYVPVQGANMANDNASIGMLHSAYKKIAKQFCLRAFPIVRHTYGKADLHSALATDCIEVGLSHLMEDGLPTGAYYCSIKLNDQEWQGVTNQEAMDIYAVLDAIEAIVCPKF